MSDPLSSTKNKKRQASEKDLVDEPSAKRSISSMGKAFSSLVPCLGKSGSYRTDSDNQLVENGCDGTFEKVPIEEQPTVVLSRSEEMKEVTMEKPVDVPSVVVHVENIPKGKEKTVVVEAVLKNGNIEEKKEKDKKIKDGEVVKKKEEGKRAATEQVKEHVEVDADKDHNKEKKNLTEQEEKDMKKQKKKKDHSPDTEENDEGGARKKPRMSLPRGVTALADLPTIAQQLHKKSDPVLARISFFFGDITRLQVDAIVNAANSGLRGGGGVDGAIHRAAGDDELQAECRKQERPVETGNAVVTDSCNLNTHVKRIIHAVGPIGYSALKRRQLISCYSNALRICEEEKLRSVAFCCISTGIYGYPNEDAAFSVLKYVTSYLKEEENRKKFDRIVFTLFMDVDKRHYARFAHEYAANDNCFESSDEEESGNEEGSENGRGSEKEEEKEESEKKPVKKEENKKEKEGKKEEKKEEK